MAQYELSSDERANTHLWRLKWEPGKCRSGRITLSYSSRSMAASAAPDEQDPASRDAKVGRYFDKVAASLERNIADEGNAEHSGVFGKIRVSHRMTPQRNGEIYLDILPSSKAPLPAKVLRAALGRPTIVISRLGDPERPVLKSFLPKNTLNKALAELLNDRGPDRLPPRTDEKLFRTQALVSAVAAGSKER